MRFTLGGRTYDLTTRCLVIGRAATVADARRLVDDGADAIELADPDPADIAADVAAFVAALDVPVGIATARLDAVRTAYQAGAVFGSCPDPPFLALSAEAGATVVTSDAAQALAAGLPAHRIAVDVPPGIRTAAAATATTPATLVTTDDIGAMAAAVTYGARLVRTANVKSARRVTDVLAAIFEATP